MFKHPTYLVLDLPQAPWIDEVQSFRAKHEAWRRKLPVEITLVGSSGVGVFAEDENPERAVETIHRLALKLRPLRFRFIAKTSFPNTRLFYFEPSQPTLFIQLHEKILATGLRFRSSPFPFTPHCTIADLGAAPSADALRELAAIPVPTEEIVAAAISFYQFIDGKCVHAHRSPFG